MVVPFPGDPSDRTETKYSQPGGRFREADEARPADEGAVDVGLAQEARDVARLHRTAVQDAGAGCRIRTELLGDDLTELRADLLGLIGRRGLARADGPDRLVRDHDLGVRGDSLERDAQLSDGDGARAVLLEVGGRLAHADHRAQAVAERRGDLRGHDVVGFGVVFAPFRVADDHIRRVELREERPRDLARVGAGIVHRQVLRAEGERDLVGVDERLHRAQIGEGREQRDLDGVGFVLRVLQRPVQLLHERDGLEVIQVHLPVARDERRPGHSDHPRTSSPGSFLPSRNSRLAPPPVEI
ncbi:MAG: hypothetical protein K0Q58_1585 [Microbacterium sp.]|nr:hypothetical protein [Microbacterium sp.]